PQGPVYRRTARAHDLSLKEVATRVRTNASAPATAVGGEVFRESKSRFVTLFLVGAASILVGVIIGAVSGLLFSLAAGAGVLICSLLGGIPMMASAAKGLWNNARYLVGNDRLQYLQGDSGVVGQVPYDNIATIKLITPRGEETIGLRLEDPQRADSFWGG